MFLVAEVSAGSNPRCPIVIFAVTACYEIKTQIHALTVPCLYDQWINSMRRCLALSQFSAIYLTQINQLPLSLYVIETDLILRMEKI